MKPKTPPMPLGKAKATVRKSLRLLKDLARGLRGKLQPDVERAYQVVLKAAR